MNVPQDTTKGTYNGNTQGKDHRKIPKYKLRIPIPT